MMEIKTDDYSLWYDTNNTTLFCEGSLRLSGIEEYSDIVQLLNDVSDIENIKIINLDLQKLTFLNSSGINILSKFVIKIRQKENTQMVVIGSKNVPWQSKSLKNLQRLMPNLQMQWQ